MEIKETKAPTLTWSSNGFVVGTNVQQNVPYEQRCKACSGKGWDADWGGPYICDECGGTGKQREKEVNNVENGTKPPR